MWPSLLPTLLISRLRHKLPRHSDNRAGDDQRGRSPAAHVALLQTEIYSGFRFPERIGMKSGMQGWTWTKHAWGGECRRSGGMRERRSGEQLEGDGSRCRSYLGEVSEQGEARLANLWHRILHSMKMSVFP